MPSLIKRRRHAVSANMGGFLHIRIYYARARGVPHDAHHRGGSVFARACARHHRRRRQDRGAEGRTRNDYPQHHLRRLSHHHPRHAGGAAAVYYGVCDSGDSWISARTDGYSYFRHQFGRICRRESARRYPVGGCGADGSGALFGTGRGAGDAAHSHPAGCSKRHPSSAW